MNAYNPITVSHRLQSKGFTQEQADALAEESHWAMSSLVTQEQLNAALDRQTIRLCGAIAAMLAVAVTISKIFA